MYRFVVRNGKEISSRTWKSILRIMDKHWEPSETFKEDFLHHDIFFLYGKRKLLAFGFDDTLDKSFALTNITVNTKFKGYGSKLLDYVKEIKDSITIEVWNDASLIHFYRKNGFEVVKVYKGKMKRPKHHNEKAKYVWLMRWKK